MLDNFGGIVLDRVAGEFWAMALSQKLVVLFLIGKLAGTNVLVDYLFAIFSYTF